MPTTPTQRELPRVLSWMVNAARAHVWWRLQNEISSLWVYDSCPSGSQGSIVGALSLTTA
jgi:hypothetical protein